YNRTNTMFASASSLLSRRMAPPSLRPRRTLLIAVAIVALGLSVPGANAVARNGQSLQNATLEGAPSAAEDAAVQAEATQLRARYHGDPAALVTSAQAALSAGRNDATIAFFLKRGWADRLNAALERYAAMLGRADIRSLALADAGIQHYATQLHASLMQSGPARLITISLQAQRLTAYDRGRVVVDTLVTTGRPALATDVGAMQITRKDSPWTMRSPWPKGSPEWYPDTPVRMVLWFTENGEGLHDASWQPDATLGPGSPIGSPPSTSTSRFGARLSCPRSAVRLMTSPAPNAASCPDPIGARFAPTVPRPARTYTRPLKSRRHGRRSSAPGLMVACNKV